MSLSASKGQTARQAWDKSSATVRLKTRRPVETPTPLIPLIYNIALLWSACRLTRWTETQTVGLRIRQTIKSQQGDFYRRDDGIRKRS